MSDLKSFQTPWANPASALGLEDSQLKEAFNKQKKIVDSEIREIENFKWNTGRDFYRVDWSSDTGL